MGATSADLDVAPTGSRERDLRAEVRAFLAAELPPERRRALGQAGGFDPAFSRRLAERGGVGMALPKEHGGQDATAVERFVVAEELLAAQAPVSAHWVADRQAAPSILAHGTAEQKEFFLPAIAAGRCFFAIGMSEPGAGSDLAAVRTRATRVEGGWRVSGTKVWTTWAQHVDWFAVLCRTSDEPDRHRGLSQLLVDLRAPGVGIRPIRTLDGDEDFCEVQLDDVFVPDSRVLGELGSGWPQVTSELAFERYGPERWMSAWGVFLAAIDACGPDPDRAQLETIGRLAARHRVIRQLSIAAAWAVDAGEKPVEQAAVAKDLGTVFEQEVVEAVRDLLAVELDPTSTDRYHDVVARAVLQQPIFTIRGGTTEVLRTILAKGLRA